MTQRHGNSDSIGRLIARELRSGNRTKCMKQDCDAAPFKGSRYCIQHEGHYGPMCMDPDLCAGKGYCPRDPTCAD